MIKERSDKRKPLGSNDKEKIRTKIGRYRGYFIGVFLVSMKDVMIEVVLCICIYVQRTSILI